MNQMSRYDEYAICKQRGHEHEVNKLVDFLTDIFWTICKRCGTRYRYEQQLVEDYNVPDPPEFGT